MAKPKVSRQMSDPVSLVKAFIHDYFQWNSKAHERSERAGDSDTAEIRTMRAAEREYAKLLAQYCRPGFQGEPIAFGIPPAHDPTREVIVSTKIRGERCLVKTKMALNWGDVELENDWEYKLACTAGRWYLESVKSVIDGRKYESL